MTLVGVVHAVRPQAPVFPRVSPAPGAAPLHLVPPASRRRAVVTAVPDGDTVRGASRTMMLAALRGDLWVTRGRETVALREGAFVLLWGGEGWAVRGARRALMLEVRLRPRALAGDDARRRGSELHGAERVAHASPRMRARVAEVVRALVAAADVDDDDDGRIGHSVDALAAELRAYLDEAVLRVPRVPAAKRATRWDIYRRLEGARAYAQQALGGATPATPVSRPLTLADLASAVCLSPHHFARSFSAVYGESPIAHVTRARLARARALLEEGASVTSCGAGRAVGFHNPSAFTRAFVRQFGVTPTACRAAPEQPPPATAAGTGV